MRSVAEAFRRLLRDARQRGSGGTRARIIIGLPVLLVASLLIGVLVLTPRTPTDGPFTYTKTWTLVELIRHIESGEVTAIALTDGQPVPGAGATGIDGQPAGSAAPAPNGGNTIFDDTSGSLVARTKSGDVLVDLVVKPSDALMSLRGAGYGTLFTTSAIDATPAIVPTQSAISALASVIYTVAIIGFLFWLLRKMGPMLGGRSGGPGSNGGFRAILPGGKRLPGSKNAKSGPAGGSIPPDQVPVRFTDVAGCEEAKLELTEVIEFLSAPQRFAALGAVAPRGVLLYGPPGTGKTMLAKAVAVEAGVPFLTASGSEFVEMYVGVGASRVRGLFDAARKLGRAVIFIDELDAIGKTRGGGGPGSGQNDERDQTLNQILVELDGFSSADEIVVIAATNRVETLDEALTRPGRFTRKVHIGLPDVEGRRAILAVHSRNKPLASDVSLDAVARITAGFSGAMIADLLNEAAILAARRGVEVIAAEDLRAGWLKVAVGTGRRRSMDARERCIIAAHEAGHAVIGKVHGDKQRVEEISLFQHGDALGITASSAEDNSLPSEPHIRARLIALMGGRAAEDMFFQERTPGGSKDFEQATDLATRMVTQWGMGEDPENPGSGPTGRGILSLIVAKDGPTLSPELKDAQGRAITHIINQAYETAQNTLLDERARVERTAAYLFEHERIDGDDFDALFAGTKHPSPEMAREWLVASAKPRSLDETDLMDLRNRVGLPAEELRVGSERDATPIAPDLPTLDTSSQTVPARRRGGRRRKAGSLRGRLARGAQAVADTLDGPARER
jgi:ATP-dependent metalloprotease FtsH